MGKTLPGPEDTWSVLRWQERWQERLGAGRQAVGGVSQKQCSELWQKEFGVNHSHPGVPSLCFLCICICPVLSSLGSLYRSQVPEDKADLGGWGGWGNGEPPPRARPPSCWGYHVLILHHCPWRFSFCVSISWRPALVAMLGWGSSV